ncbi:MAG: D-alanyl-D-alanine dipeptidase [Rickettsiales bacterium]|nr:D-alanyl-D-alanine dipeptidase [Rickettsiales bacterium]
MQNLVEISTKNFDVILDLRYASKNNVCGQKLYAYPFCYLHETAAQGLKRAIKLAKNLGLKIKIFDGFRPLQIQQFMYEKFSQDGFVSNPKTGAIPHCRGIAIDLTLTDLQGNNLEMGTDFDDFSKLAFHGCDKISITAQRNRLILLGIMTAAGFDFYSQEWWHYQLFKPREYPIIKADKNMILIDD